MQGGGPARGRRAGLRLTGAERASAVSESLRQKVLLAVSELDYEPDFTAMSLRRGSSMTVAFLVRDIANPLFSDMVKAAESVLHRVGYSVLLLNSDGDPGRDAEHIRLFARRRVDGLIASLATESHQDSISASGPSRRRSCWSIGTCRRSTPASVSSDHYSGRSAGGEAPRPTRSPADRD